MPPMMFFDMAPLRVALCFLGAINTMYRLFEEGFELDGREFLSVYSDLN